MPLRVKSRPQHGANDPPRSPSPSAGPRQYSYGLDRLPDIQDHDSFRILVKKLSIYFNRTVTLSVTFEQLRTTSAGEGLQLLVEHLNRHCRNSAVVNALLALKWHYGAAKVEKSVNEARAFAAEIVAWRFLAHLSEREVVDFCLYEIPDPNEDEDLDQGQSCDEENGSQSRFPDENTSLLARNFTGSMKSAGDVVKKGGPSKRNQLLRSISRLATFGDSDEEDEVEDPTKPFVGLNALEIAAVVDAKRFLAQHVVQTIITSIWNGNIIFWDQLAIDTVKRPRFYNRATADPFSRLRVPKYLKSYEVLFFLVFLFLYYAVLVERDPDKFSLAEILLYLWFAAFTYDELSEWIDAGSIFYTTDVWNLFDITMILIGIVFAIMRIVGLSRHDGPLIEQSFDVLSLEALFMIPRVASILSLSPYWGTLVPCLKEMGKDFVKFMVLVVILYFSFLTTFSLIGREHFDLKNMAFILSKIFYGSTYLGFDYMYDIDPLLGPPLMYIFVTLSSILLMGSLTGMLSNSFSRVISHAREEYLYIYSVYVLEASTSNRLTHFYPPFNLLPLLTLRPVRLILPSNNTLRRARILLLKATHVPIVGFIYLYELLMGHVNHKEYTGFKGPRIETGIAVGAPAYGYHTTSSSAPQRTTSRSKLRPASSSSQRQGRPAHRASVSVFEPLPPPHVMSVRTCAVHSLSPAAAALGDAANDDVDAPTEVDVKISELSGKIDRLTEVILSMQRERQERREVW